MCLTRSFLPYFQRHTSKLRLLDQQSQSRRPSLPGLCDGHSQQPRIRFLYGKRRRRGGHGLGPCFVAAGESHSRAPLPSQRSQSDTSLSPAPASAPATAAPPSPLWSYPPPPRPGGDLLLDTTRPGRAHPQQRRGVRGQDRRCPRPDVPRISTASPVVQVQGPGSHQGPREPSSPDLAKHPHSLRADPPRGGAYISAGHAQHARQSVPRPPRAARGDPGVLTTCSGRHLHPRSAQGVHPTGVVVADECSEVIGIGGPHLAVRDERLQDAGQPTPEEQRAEVVELR